MTIKIKTTPLGISRKTINVKGSVGQFDQSLLLQIKLLQSDTIDDLEPVEVLEKLHDTLAAMKDFLSDVLGLTESEINKAMHNLDRDEFSQYVNYVISRLQGMSEQEYAHQAQLEADLKAASEDPKENADESEN